MVIWMTSTLKLHSASGMEQILASGASCKRTHRVVKDAPWSDHWECNLTPSQRPIHPRAMYAWSYYAYYLAPRRAPGRQRFVCRPNPTHLWAYKSIARIRVSRLAKSAHKSVPTAACPNKQLIALARSRNYFCKISLICMACKDDASCLWKWPSS